MLLYEVKSKRKGFFIVFRRVLFLIVFLFVWKDIVLKCVRLVGRVGFGFGDVLIGNRLLVIF